MRSQPCRSGKQARGGSWCADPGKVSFRPPLSPLRSHLTLSFSNFCPFTVMRLRELPNPKIYTRQERYRAQPPRVSEPWGFHSENSLAVYQGLVYYLLWLHSKYDKVGAVRGGSYLRWYRRGFYAGEPRRRAEQSRAASVLPRLKGGRGGDQARLRRDGFGLGARVGGRPKAGVGCVSFSLGQGQGLRLGTLPVWARPLTYPPPPLGACNSCSHTRSQHTTPPGAGGRTRSRTRCVERMASRGTGPSPDLPLTVPLSRH